MSLIQNLKQKIRKQILKRVNLIDPQEVITKNNAGMPFINGKKITSQEMKLLRDEVKIIKQTKVWKIITDSVVDQARKVMFESCQSYEDLQCGKLMLYNIGVQKNILKLLESETFDEKMKQVLGKK